jgi:cyclase
VNSPNLRVIARLDVKNGKLIKGIHLEGLRVLGDPNSFALNYYANGIDEIILLDPVASLYGRNNLGDVLGSAVNDIFVPITAGGGVQTLDDARRLLRAGADKVAVNTGAMKRPALIREIAEEFGSQAMVLSIESKKIGNEWIAYTENGRESSHLRVIDWLAEGIELGAGEVLLTSIDKEGTRRGFDLELISRINLKVNVPFIVCGGMGNLTDLDPLFDFNNVDAIGVAGLFHYGLETISSVKTHARNLGYQVRT